MNKIKDSDYHFEYQAEPIQEDEQVLFGVVSPNRRNLSISSKLVITPSQSQPK